LNAASKASSVAASAWASKDIPGFRNGRIDIAATPHGRAHATNAPLTRHNQAKMWLSFGLGRFGCTRLWPELPRCQCPSKRSPRRCPALLCSPDRLRVYT
jgi:hypothetical protein